MSTLLKFKKSSESELSGKLFKLDNTAYGANEEVIYTDIPMKPLINSTSIID